MFLVKSTVSNFEQEGHEAWPKEAEKSIKQALQNTCSQAVTCDNKENILDGKSIKQKL